MDKLTIDRNQFTSAFGRDGDYDYEEYPQLAYLDRRSGEVLWIFEEDDDAENVMSTPAEENRRDRERVEAAPDRYLEIPCLDHGDHHDALKAFLRSDWCGDEARMQRAEDAYNGSIGRWKKAVRDRDAVHKFYAFQEQQAVTLAEAYLREQGIEVVWR